ncbi:MAG TPA: FkbM family methyltransferase [Solirubrobacteraceae bacterium]
MSRLKEFLDWIGVNRSALVRGLVRQGNPRLRELRAGALAGGNVRARAQGVFVRWLESGWLRVQTGRAGMIRLSLQYLPISHSQIGSIAFGDLESPVQEAIVRHLAPGAVMYDIGANIGFFSLLGARLAGPEPGHVYAFEPAPVNAEAIRVNASRNEFSNVTVIAKAVGDAQQRVRLQLVDDAAWSKLEGYGAHPLTEDVLEVEQVAIDELIAAGEIRPPALVKIDVEGAELAVLQGMRETIAIHQPAIVCELHGTNREFVAAMDAVGYRVINLDGPGPVDQPGAGSYALALPRTSPGD